MLRDRIHNDGNQRGPVPFALPKVERQIWGGLPWMVVMQSANGRKPANKEQESEAQKGALWMGDFPVAADC